MNEITESELKFQILKKKKEEREKQVRLQNRLWFFCQRSLPEFYTEERSHYIEKLCDNLQYLAEINGLVDCNVMTKKYSHLGHFLKMMINMPPQSGKSLTVSHFCAWLLGHNPKKSIMRNTYGSKLAEKFSSDVQSIVESDAFVEAFGKGIYIDQKKTAKEAWALNTSNDFAYVCAGVGGSSTGLGCNLIGIADDLVKDVQVAMNTTVLESIYMWYNFVHRDRFRKQPPTPELHICTRWSRKDPAGRVLREERGEWLEFKYPALILNEKGEYKTFGKAYDTTENLIKRWNLSKERNLEHLFRAVYQQEPIEKGGLLFPPDRLHHYRRRDLPPADYKMGWCDVADEGADSLCSPIAHVRGEKIFIIDVIHTTASSEVTEGLVADQIMKQRPSEHTFESNAGGKIYARNVKKKLPESLRHIVKWQRTTTNKETRIILSAPQIINNFYFLHPDEQDYEYKRYYNEMIDYVKGKKNQRDDGPDATSALSQKLFSSNKITAGILGD